MKEMYFHEIAVYRVPISIKKIKTKKARYLFQKVPVVI